MSEPPEIIPRLALARLLRRRGRAMVDANESGNSDARDNAELVNVLARMVEGKSIHSAFGAPGSWGYGTSIGEALREFYAHPTSEPLILAAWASFHAISSLLAVRDGMTDEALEDLREHIATTLIASGSMSKEAKDRFDGKKADPTERPS